MRRTSLLLYICIVFYIFSTLKKQQSRTRPTQPVKYSAMRGFIILCYGVYKKQARSILVNMRI